MTIFVLFEVEKNTHRNIPNYSVDKSISERIVTIYETDGMRTVVKE